MDIRRTMTLTLMDDGTIRRTNEFPVPTLVLTASPNGVNLSGPIDDYFAASMMLKGAQNSLDAYTAQKRQMAAQNLIAVNGNLEKLNLPPPPGKE